MNTYTLKKTTVKGSELINDRQSMDQVMDYMRSLEKKGYNVYFNSLTAFAQDNSEIHKAITEN